MLVRVRTIIQPRAVGKVRVRHTQLLRPLVHPLYKRCLAPGDMLCQRARAVVCRRNHHRLEHLRQRQLLVFLQIDLTSALCRRGSRGRHHIVPTDSAVFECLHHQQQRHHLRHACRTQLFVGIVLIQYLARRFFHQNARRRGKLQLRRPSRLRHQPQRHRCQNQPCSPSSHKKIPLRFSFGTSV